MALNFDWSNKVVESSASITDLPAFHASLRDAEYSATGLLYPAVHKWKALDLGGAFFYQADFINGWTLKFPTAGNYTITGNLNATIAPVAGVYVERKTSAAFATSSSAGFSALTNAEIQQMAARVFDLAQIHGLVLGSPLNVAQTTRVAGTVNQTLSEAGGATIVTRLP